MSISGPSHKNYPNGSILLHPSIQMHLCDMGHEEGIGHAQELGATRPAQLYKVDAEDLHDPGSLHL